MIDAAPSRSLDAIISQAASKVSAGLGILERDNGYDHQAGTVRTSDSPFQKQAQARRRVYRFVILRCGDAPMTSTI